VEGGAGRRSRTLSSWCCSYSTTAASFELVALACPHPRVLLGTSGASVVRINGAVRGLGDIEAVGNGAAWMPPKE
jgi:hypothetical protein